MIDAKLYSLLKVAETGNFTRAAEQLALTQPAVSQHIHQLEKDLEVKIFDRSSSRLHITREGETVIRYARRMLSLYGNLQRDLKNSRAQVTSLSVGVTHTAESNPIAETLAKYVQDHDGMKIKIITDTINNLYDMIKNFEVDLAIVEGRCSNPSLHSLMLDTDYLVLAVSLNHRLARQSMVTINELKREKLILRLPDSNTRNLFAASLESQNLSIEDFNVVLEINNIATIKELVRHDFGVSVLARSVCLDELKKRQIAVLPIENLSMMREINIVYSQDFAHLELLQDIAQTYHETRGRVREG